VSKPVLQIIIGSTRPGRVGLPVAEWTFEQAVAHGAFDVRLVDLAEVNLPLLDEPKHPRFGDYAQEHTRRWSQSVTKADAFVFVVPEYNFGYNAALKNAIDFLHEEWKYKAVGFVSYGGVAAGTRAVQGLKQVVTALKMVPLFEAVSIPFVAQLLDEQRRLKANDVMLQAADAMFDELLRWTAALCSLRTD
jgi:NAD(P)H-dependent FMN reductase